MAADWATALVTGAASGIGRAFAETLGHAGVALRLLDVDEPALAAIAGQLEARTARADVSDRAVLEDAVASLLGEREGLDLLVHCAAILGPGTWAAQASADFERVLAIDFLGTSRSTSWRVRQCRWWRRRSP